MPMPWEPREVKPTVADHVAAFLVDRGVEQVFGLCGHTNISLLAAFERLGAPRFVTTRHEQVAAHAADGYARASGQPGVVLLHVGPGHDQRDDGRRNGRVRLDPDARDRGRRAVVLRGTRAAPGVQLRRDADQVSVYEPFVKRAWRVRRADQVPRILARAWDTALAGRPGPGPRLGPDGHPRRGPRRATSSPPRPWRGRHSRHETAAAIAAELRAAPRDRCCWPGGGTRRAAARFASWPSCAGLPVVHTLMGTGILPPDHPQLLGMIGFWGSPPANRLAAEADVILAVGTRFPETDSSSWEPGVTFRIPPTRLIHVDIDPHEPGRNYPAAIAATADAALALRRSPMPTATRRRTAGTTGTACARSARRSSPRAASTHVGRVPAAARADPRRRPARRSRRDPGHRCRLEQERRRAAVPGRHARTRSSRPAGSRRWASARRRSSASCRPAPGRPAIALVGDGAFGSNPSVIATAVEMGDRPGVGRHEQRRVRDHRRAASASTTGRVRVRVRGRRSPYTPDFAAMARACGADGIRIERPERAPGRAARGVRVRPSDRDRRPHAQHAGDDARGVGHRADLPGGPMSDDRRRVATGPRG